MVFLVDGIGFPTLVAIYGVFFVRFVMGVDRLIQSWMTKTDPVVSFFQSSRDGKNGPFTSLMFHRMMNEVNFDRTLVR